MDVISGNDILISSHRAVHGLPIVKTNISEGVLDDIGLEWGESLSELSIGQLRVSVQIKSPHDCCKLVLDWLMASPFEEAPDGTFFDDTVIVIIDCLESPLDAKALKLL